MKLLYQWNSHGDEKIFSIDNDGNVQATLPDYIVFRKSSDGPCHGWAIIQAEAQNIWYEFVYWETKSCLKFIKVTADLINQEKLSLISMLQRMPCDDRMGYNAMIRSEIKALKFVLKEFFQK